MFSISPGYHSPVADPDLQIRGAGYPDPEIGGPGLKNFFSAFVPQFGLKIRVGPRPPGPLPWIRHCSRPKQELINLLLTWSQEKCHSSCKIDYFTVVLLLLTLAFNESEAARAVKA